MSRAGQLASLASRGSPLGARTLLRQLAGRPLHDPADAVVRLAVRLRARDACEYCLLPTGGLFQVDHIIPPALWDYYSAGRLDVSPRQGRRGPHNVDNYAWACPFCNLAKAQQTAHPVGHRNIRLYDPRRDRWDRHFVFLHNYLFIVGTSHIGRATEAALGFNDARPGGPLGTRHDAILVGRYPPSWTRHLLVSVD